MPEARFTGGDGGGMQVTEETGPDSHTNLILVNSDPQSPVIDHQFLVTAVSTCRRAYGLLQHPSPVCLTHLCVNYVPHANFGE